MNTKEKSTKDLYLAAAYLALGAEYLRTDRADPKNMIFWFAPKKFDSVSLPEAPVQDLDRMEAQWVNDTLVVSAVKYAAAIKHMKSLVHSF